LLHYQGSTVILQGELGLGKSSVLGSVLRDLPTVVHCATAEGNTFRLHEHLYVWRELILQLLDKADEEDETDTHAAAAAAAVAAAGGGDCDAAATAAAATATATAAAAALVEDDMGDSSASPQPDAVPLRRRRCLVRMLKASSSSHRHLPLIGVLNDCFPSFKYTESEHTVVMSATSRSHHAQAALLALLQAFSAKRSIVIVIDKAEDICNASWSMLLKCSRLVLNCIFIVGMRVRKATIYDNV
jgi:hypothetical protein